MNTQLETRGEDDVRQMESLAAELSSRKSTVHFAHAGVSMVWSLIIAGAAAKLSWDSWHHWWVGVSVGVVSLGVWLYSMRHYRLGKKVLAQELERFEVLKTLRRKLQVDDPSALLPQ